MRVTNTIMRHTRDQSVSLLVSRAVSIAGSQGKLAKAAGRSQNAIWHAISRGRISAELACDIHRATGGQVSRTSLRPDIFSDGEVSPPTDGKLE